MKICLIIFPKQPGNSIIRVSYTPNLAVGQHSDTGGIHKQQMPVRPSKDAIHRNPWKIIPGYPYNYGRIITSRYALL